MSVDSFPGSILTERLLLRPYEAADAHRVLQLVCENRPNLIRNFGPMVKQVSSAEGALSFVRDKLEQWDLRKTFCYGLWLKSSGALLGQVQVKNIVWDVPSAELSYFIGSTFQRQGFAVEALNAILEVAFQQLGFERIFVRIIPANKESIGLAVKLGFKYEGLHRKDFRCGLGELHDVEYYSVTR